MPLAYLPISHTTGVDLFHLLLKCQAEVTLVVDEAQSQALPQAAHRRLVRANEVAAISYAASWCACTNV